jgi:SAM-dependent methyltransferase
MKCYLCGKEARIRHPKCRDRDIPVWECECGLVFLKNDGSCDYYTSKPKEWEKACVEDDERRFLLTRSLITNKTILDFGCGMGGYLRLAKQVASSVQGVEPNVEGFKDIAVTKELDISREYDVITMFHVLEHEKDPVATLNRLGKVLRGTMIIEVPSADDALLSLYDCDAFKDFTYWSDHRFLFTEATLKEVIKRSGLALQAIKNVQRYHLSNHLYWLSKGKPGGHNEWMFLNSPELKNAYEASLASIGKTDTLVAYVKNIR